MKSKFFNLKNNKGKKHNTEKPAEEIPMLSEEETETLLESLNEEPEEPAKPEPVKVPEVVKEPLTKNFEAHGICFSNAHNKFMKITIDYNPETGYSSFKTADPWADDPTTALRKLMRHLSLKLLKREDQY